MTAGSFLSKSSRILLAAAALLAAGPARAQRTLALDEALAIARRNNRDLKAAQARVDQSSALVLQAWSALLPTATAQGKYTHNYKEVTLDLSAQNQGFVGLAEAIKMGFSGNQPLIDALNNYERQLAAAAAGPPIVIQKGEQLDFALNVLVPILVPFAYPALQAAKKNEASGRANLSVSEATVLFATAQAYYACAGADELGEARRHAVVVAKKALDNAKARLEAGVVNRVEVTRAELQLVRAEQALLESQDAQASAYRALATVMNMREPVRVVPAEEPPRLEQPVATLAEHALSLRPEFAALERTVDGNRLTASSNAWRWAPTVSAFGNLRAFNYAGFSGDKYAWAVGLQLDWTLYDGGIRDAQRKLARAQRLENEAKLDLLRDQVRDDVYNADRQLATRRRALDTARRSVQLSKETLELVQVQHDAGTATQLDLLQAQDALVAAEVALAQARFDLALGALSLERLSGTFPSNRSLK